MNCMNEPMNQNAQPSPPTNSSVCRVNRLPKIRYMRWSSALLLLLACLARPGCPVSCPTSKITCPLCFSIVEKFNTDGSVPPRIADFCDLLQTEWLPSFETLTGKVYDSVREHARCEAVGVGVQEVIRGGCALPHCSPETACATFC